MNTNQEFDSKLMWKNIGIQMATGIILVKASFLFERMANGTKVEMEKEQQT